MNISMYDISSTSLIISDLIKLISSDPDDLQSVDEIALKMNTISYEVITKLSPTIRRIVI